MPRDETYGIKMKISRRARYEREHPNVLSAMYPADKKNYLEGMFDKKDKVRFWCDRCNNWYFISIDAHKGAP